MARVVKAMLWAILMAAGSMDQQLAEAHRLYQEGEKAKEDIQAMQAFNEALAIYRALAHDHESSALYSNVANCYYQLSAFPWAILYYERAHLLAPRDRHIRHQLNQARAAAGVSLQAQGKHWLAAVLGSEWLSVPERVWVSLSCGLLMAVFGAVAIWRPRRVYVRFALFWAATAAILLTSVVLLELAVGQTAILIQGAVPRVDGGQHYAASSEHPLLAGSKVLVQGTTDDGAWVAIATGDGTRGYIPAENLGFR